ncbi:MAG: metallophosphoesterase [Ignavibacteriales bacterium]|nr:metallophosphoesterase [Ignavibacteriales bacterium]MCB9260567.1 metallophosphoesterase [Ignavibacteriales bacterium]
MLKIILVYFIICTSFVFSQENIPNLLGPYIQNMSDRDARICWSTYLTSVKVTDSEGKISYLPEYEQHSIELTRLNANSMYEYDIFNNGNENGKGKFITYPNEINNFNFVVLGDTRSNPDIHSQIVNGVIDTNPLFVVNTGDLVSNGRNIHDWIKFFEINKELMRNTPYYAVLGNHEKDSPYFYDFFPPPGANNYYSFSVGDALFIILDSEGKNLSAPNYLTDEYEDTFWEESFIEYFQNQKDWLNKELNLHKDAGFVFVFQHQPLYSIKESRIEDTNKRREFWGDFFEKHDVQFFINGHDHHYHHAEKNGVNYITTAGGGAPLYDTDIPQAETKKYSKVNHFISVNIEREKAVLNVIDIDGNIIDKIEAERRKTE